MFYASFVPSLMESEPEASPPIGRLPYQSLNVETNGTFQKERIGFDCHALFGLFSIEFPSEFDADDDHITLPSVAEGVDGRLI